MLAERTPIAPNGPNDIDSADKQLRAIWARIIAECKEGLVLKADDGGYNDYRSPWVKVTTSHSFCQRYALRQIYYSSRKITFLATGILSI
jgi:hypothetical protein